MYFCNKLYMRLVTTLSKFDIHGLYKLQNWKWYFFDTQTIVKGKHMPYRTNPRAQYFWRKAKPIRGKNSNLYRKDSFGNTIYKPAYGRDSRMGWQVDHIYPKSKGGSNARRNLQALQTITNKRKSNKIPRRRTAGLQKRHRRWFAKFGSYANVCFQKFWAYLGLWLERRV